MGVLWSGAVALKRLVVLLGVLVLAACATPPAINGSDATDAFKRTGRFAVSVDEVGSPAQAVQGGFAWYDTGSRLILDLANPLGSTLARVEVFPGRAQLTRSDGSVQTAPGADALVEYVVGAAVPVTGLRAWLKGNVNRSLVTNLQTTEDKMVSRFEQDGWSVALSRYDEKGPRVLQMVRTEGLRTITVRLVVDAS